MRMKLSGLVAVTWMFTACCVQCLGQESSECGPGTYFDGVNDKCYTCSSICRPKIPLNFCQRNCPDYYSEHFTSTKIPPSIGPSQGQPSPVAAALLSATSRPEAPPSVDDTAWRPHREQADLPATIIALCVVTTTVLVLVLVAAAVFAVWFFCLRTTTNSLRGGVGDVEQRSWSIDNAATSLSSSSTTSGSALKTRSDGCFDSNLRLVSDKQRSLEDAPETHSLLNVSSLNSTSGGKATDHPLYYELNQSAPPVSVVCTLSLQQIPTDDGSKVMLKYSVSRPDDAASDCNC